jgi:hypothetical protein
MHPKAFCHTHSGIYQNTMVMTAIGLTSKGAVDLDDIDWKLVQAGK